MAGQQYIPGASDTAPLPRVGAAPPPAPPRRPHPALQAGVLVLVAVVSGLIWWLIRHDSGVAGQPAAAPREDPLTSGEFHYVTASGPETSTDCAGNAYGDVAGWFAEHPCERVVRALYSTESAGARALVSVVVVTMPSAAEAQRLKVITDTEGTGNVNDLVRDGTANLPGAPQVAGGEYESRSAGRELTIVECAFFDGHSDDALLARIAEDALKLSAALR